MSIYDTQKPFKLPGSDSPLKRSTSVTAIIHGTQDKPNNVYYIDSLQRFKRDYATVDRQQRDLKRMNQQAARAKRRSITIERQLNSKKQQQLNIQKMQQKQRNSLLLHKIGSSMNIHSHGIPIDPVNHYYLDTHKGRYQEALDRDKQINQLVRSHKLQTYGTSGYNIINGRKNLTVQQMVPQQNHQIFEQKLNKYYQKFRIKVSQV